MQMQRFQNKNLHYIEAQQRGSMQSKNLKNMSHNSSIGYDHTPTAHQQSLFEELADSTDLMNPVQQPKMEQQMHGSYPDGSDKLFDNSNQQIVNI